MNQANLVLNTKTYTPDGVSNGVAQWSNRSDGIAAGFSVVKQTLKNPVTGTQIKIDHTLVVPVVASVDTACVCAGEKLRESTVTISVWVPASSTTAERTDVYLRLKDLVADTQFIKVIEDLEPAV